MKKKLLTQSYIFLHVISFIISYNNTYLKNVTADDIKGLTGEEGCRALYDSGANTTETCTQFKLNNSYICCRISYTTINYKNDFCMPIMNNSKSIGDVKYAFRHADEVEIDCNAKNIDLSFYLFLIIIFLIL